MERLLGDVESRLDGRFNGHLAVDTEDGRALSLTFEPMQSGGSVVLVEDVTERKNAEAKINHLARYDALTGLPNRIFFHDQMQWALATMKRDSSLAVLFVDLDQFKQVNDTLGHPAGDALLCAVADRLRGIVRDTDLVARFGGDEFVVLQASVRGVEGATAMAKRIVEELSTTYDIEGHRVVIGASVGIALAPRDGTGADVLLEERRHGALSGEIRRARHVALLRARDGREGAGAPQPRARPAPGGRERRIRGALPAADQPEDRPDLDLRGAAALEASASAA